jgi:acetoin utilization deacetylase AcuC-like enzyme
MKVVYDDGHRRHAADTGTWVGKTIPSEEVPERAEVIVAALSGAGHEVIAAQHHDAETLHRVHDREMIDYMRTAWEKWAGWGYLDDPGQPQVTAYAYPMPVLLDGLPLRIPKSPGALAGIYAMDTMTQIGEGTFEGARAAIDMAQTAAQMVVEGESAVYAACRPPGHHAGRRYFGGSCYLNNAAVAAETLLGGGFERVAVIDIDAHHGNGTQQIFYERSDVVYTSVHVDPAEGWYPHFVGFGDETGSGAGKGFNLNVPVAPGADDERWLEGIDRLVEAAANSNASGVVVSLGVDAAVSDPESPLQITKTGYASAGKRIASLNLPTVLVQEGGYDLETLGELVRATLEGFEEYRGSRDG